MTTLLGSLLSSSRLVLTAIVCISLIATSSRAQQPELLDKVAVVVDEQVITQRELSTRLNEIITRTRRANMQLPDEKLLLKQVVDLLVLEKLQLGLADRFKVSPGNEEVMSAVQQVMKQRGWNEQQLLAHLEEEGTSFEAFADGIRNELKMQAVAQGVVSQRISVSEQDIETFIKSADAKFWMSPDYRLSHIVIGLPSSPSADDIATAEAKINEVKTQLAKGSNFADIAIVASNGPAATKGGDLGYRKLTELPLVFEQALKDLKEGDLSDIIRTQAGFHILKVTDIRGEDKQIVEQTKARHILVKTSAIVDEQAAKEKLAKARKQIVEGDASFEELAKDMSEDLGTRMAGGDLGWANPGTFVPAFESTMQQLEKGEISQPFESRFGWHIIRVEDRRNEDLTDLALKGKARSIIQNRRFNDAKENWLQELKDEAYVQYLIPELAEYNPKKEKENKTTRKKNKKKKRSKNRQQATELM